MLARAPIEFAGCALAFSPYDEGRLAIATAANFGIVGNGAQLVFDVRPSGPPPTPPAFVPVARLLTNDGVYGCAWSETHEHRLVSACADGSLKLWDLALPPELRVRPLAAIKAHESEASSVDWSSVRKELLASSGWDRTVRVWPMDAPGTPPIASFAGSQSLEHEVRWAPHSASTLASAAGDRSARVWSLDSGRAEVVLSAHEGEVLSVDWHKYSAHTLATGCVDGLVRTWDLRLPASPISARRGHRMAVRRVRFSPHHSRLLLSCSYDMSAAVWDIAGPGAEPALATYGHHTEFVVGAEWALFTPGLFATCAWDGTVALLGAPQIGGASLR